jgi:hypothetical protein
MLLNKEKSKDILKRIKEILIEGNKPLNKSIKLRFITFIPESTILLHKAVTINNITILKDLNKQYLINKPIKERRDRRCDTSLHIELSYFTDTPDEQMYFKLGEEYIKLKSIHSNITGLDMTAYIDKETMFSGALPISIKNRNIHGIYNKEEVEQDLDNTHAQSAKLVEEYLDVTKKRLEFVDDIRKTILNDEQAKLEVQKAILKLAETVNKSEISKSVKDYKEMVKGDKADTTLVSDLLKIFKSVI